MKKSILILMAVYFFAVNVVAQKDYQPSENNLANREWFQDAKFGLFIHWDVYSIMAGGGDKGIAEWIMNKKEIPIEQYEKLPAFFNPTAFDANEWVSMTKPFTLPGKALSFPTTGVLPPKKETSCTFI